MPSKFMNGVAAKHCVTCYEHHEETALDVLEDFVDWTKKKKIKSYIAIADMLHVTPKEAKKYLDLAKMPKYDSTVLKRMKELMHGEDQNI